MDERLNPKIRRALRKWYILKLFADGTNKIPSHPDIQLLERDLKKLYHEGKLKGINLYIYGLVLKEQERLREARDVSFYQFRSLSSVSISSLTSGRPGYNCAKS